MDMRLDSIETHKKAKPPVGRQDSDGQEAPIEHQVVKDREEELVRLWSAAHEAASDLSDAIKKAAEDSGYNVAAVRKRIASLANDTYEREKKKAAQLALIFEVED